MRRGRATIPPLLIAAALAGASALMPVSAFSSGQTAGSTAQFLRIGAGARALGMGEAFGPVAQGPDAIYWNPAGLAQVQQPELSYSHIEMLRFFHHDHVAYAHPTPFLRGIVGASLTAFYQDSLDLVTNTNQVVGSFQPHSEALTLAYARAFSVGEERAVRGRGLFRDIWYLSDAYKRLDRRNDMWTGDLLAGAAVKYVRETLYEYSASAVAVDGGVLYRLPDLHELTLSFAFRNVGTRPKFVNRRESLPAEADIGAAYSASWEDSQLISALDIAVPLHGAPFAKAGLEWTLGIGGDSFAAVRAGYKSLPASDLGAMAGFTGGVGLGHGRFTLDLAFQPMAELGEVYRASLGWRF
ncbi:MAG: UPF0164 family protein [Elusimicrobiota bacterium]